MTRPRTWTKVTDSHRTWTKAIAAHEPNVPHMPTYLFTHDVEDTEDIDEQTLGANIPALVEDDEQINDDADDTTDSDSDTVDNAIIQEPLSPSPEIRRVALACEKPLQFSALEKLLHLMNTTKIHLQQSTLTIMMKTTIVKRTTPIVKKS